MATEKKGSPESGKKSRKGRAPRVYLTDEQKRLIISSIEAGGTLDSAARAARISPRTLRELRQRARGRHPTRSALPHLKPFFDDVDQAIGRRLLTNEIWLSEHDPKYALKYLRSRLDAEGEDEEPVRVPTAEEMQQELDVLISSGAFRSPRCHENCSCDHHGGERRTS
ncbi:MAG: hypothetical protein WD670_03680 [Actinomycetota bacterium]